MDEGKSQLICVHRRELGQRGDRLEARGKEVNVGKAEGGRGKFG